jgi:anti-anti-sigma factor
VKGFSIRELQGSAVVGITLLDKYLNYDIADSLKAHLKDAVSEWQGRGCRHFCFDLSNVSIIDSCGVSVMIALHNSILGSGGQCYLAHLTPFIRRILRMMHLDGYFRVCESEEEVLELAGGRVS